MQMKWFLFLLFVPLLVSCATTKPTSSGFISNTKQLSYEGKDLRYKKSGVNFQEIKKVYLSPVELRADDNPVNRELITYYQTALKEAFSKHYQVVSKPSSGVLVVRAAITKINTVNVGLNVVTSIVAVPVDNGGASAEAEMLLDKERVYAESRSVAGGLRGAGSFKSKTLGYISKTSHAKSALKTLAEDLVLTIRKK